ncbi:prothymosin alpha-B-like isoform X2 [Salvelinus fontinalis]|uniref:prothymosin alpha-B-like isoform X2 n=1 Tax=Salvelinus fontinalis TaxID=8038 RepID=UPI00248503A8|nr:prothymosin alpha-B-like isoform X2 [Salvelinus fontinalis]
MADTAVDTTTTTEISAKHTNGAETKTNGADDSEETPVGEKEEEDGEGLDAAKDAEEVAGEEVDHPVKCPADEGVDHPVKHPADEEVDHPVKLPADEVDHPVKRPADEEDQVETKKQKTENGESKEAEVKA